MKNCSVKCQIKKTDTFLTSHGQKKKTDVFLITVTMALFCPGDPVRHASVTLSHGIRTLKHKQLNGIHYSFHCLHHFLPLLFILSHVRLFAPMKVDCFLHRQQNLQIKDASVKKGKFSNYMCSLR